MAFQLSHHWKHTEDPHRVPEHDLLRQRRAGHRGGGAHLLRLGPRVRPLQPRRGGQERLRRRRPRAPPSHGMRERADACAGGAARRDRRQPDRVQSRRYAERARRRARTPQPGAGGHVPPALHLLRPLPVLAEPAAADPGPDQAAGAAALGRPLLHELGRTPGGAGTRAPGPLAEGSTVRSRLRRPQDQAEHRPQPAAAGTGGVDDELPAGEGLPSASLVAISNKTGEVRAMVSGDDDYQQSPFNLATMGYRQPGSSFKLFTLAAALSRGAVTPY